MNVTLECGTTLERDDLFNLLNARNFTYYCEMIDGIREGKCPFCNPIDLKKNTVCAQVGTWRMWPCPTKLSPEGLSEHIVMAPVGEKGEHPTHISSLTDEQWRDFCGLFVSQILPGLKGPLLVPNTGPAQDMICCEVIVPDRTRRIEVVFKAVFGQEHYPLQPYIRRDKWCIGSAEMAIGLKDRYIVFPSYDRDFSALDKEEMYQAMIQCAWIAGEFGMGLAGGAIIMGLPGAALTMRFGDPTLHAGSVHHLHCNIKKSGSSGVVKETIAKDPAEIMVKEQVVWAWERMRIHKNKNPHMSEGELVKCLPPQYQKLLAART